MKRILFLPMLIVLSLFTHAQDVGVTSINVPLPGATLHYGQAVGFNFTITNFGSAAITPADSVRARIFLPNSTSVGISLPNLNIAPGGAISIPISPAFIMNSALSPVGVQQFCIATVWSSDQNTANDQLCENYTVTSTPQTAGMDVGIADISFPYAGDTLQVSEQTIVNFTLANFGTVALTDTNTIPVVLDFFGDMYNIDLELPTGLVINPGLSVDIATPFMLTVPAVPAGQNDICATTNYSLDINNANDGTCESYYIDTAAAAMIYDIGIIQLNSPSDSVLMVGQVTDSIEVTLANYGNTAIKPTDVIDIYVSIFGTVAPKITLSPPQNFPPNTAATLNLGPVPVLLGTPLGFQDICVWAEWSVDQNSSNDTVCGTFKIVNNVGIAELNAATEIVYYNNFLRLKMATEQPGKQAKVILTDATGRVVMSDYFVGMQNKEYDLSRYAPGMYIFTIYSTEGITSKKFIKQ